jgi:cellulose biosynthesis protein BcsQ
VQEPKLTKTFLNYFKKLDTKHKTCLEIGSGDSILFLSKRFKYLSSLESHKPWYKKIIQNKPNNVDIKLFKKSNIIEILKKELQKKPDFVIIDNNPNYISRLDIAIFIHLNKKNDCIIVLDNGNWNLDAFWFLRSHYFCLDFFGKNYEDETTITSIFFTDKNSNYVY